MGAANRAAEKHEAAMILAGPEHLPRVPRERCAVERDKDQVGLSAGDEERRIIEAQPRSLAPRSDVNDRKSRL